MKPELHINFRDRLAKLSTMNQKAIRWQKLKSQWVWQAWPRWTEGEDNAACWWCRRVGSGLLNGAIQNLEEWKACLSGINCQVRCGLRQCQRHKARQGLFVTGQSGPCCDRDVGL